MDGRGGLGIRMFRKSLMIHGLWAVGVVAAFVVGSRSQLDRSAEAETASARAAKIDRARDRDGVDATGRGARIGDREGLTGRRGSLLENLFGGVATADAGLDALIEQSLRDPNPVVRKLAFARLLEAMTPENAKQIREQLVALGADREQWQDFHYSWGAIAGKEAFDHAAASEERDLEATLTGWAAANPSEAMALLDNLPEELRGQRNDLAESVVSGLADADRALAVDLVMKLAAEGHERADRLMAIVAGEELRAGGPEAAASWAETLPDGELKGAALDRVADRYVRENPEAAARWAEQFADQDYAARAISTLGEEWAERDPQAAVGWLERLPEGRGQMSGLQSAFGDWEDRDPEAAGKHLLSMSPSPQRDSAISGFAAGYAWQDPQTAIAWAQDISDPALRQSSLTRAGQAFFRRDPEAAKAWLESSGLPQSAVQEVMSPNGRWRR